MSTTTGSGKLTLLNSTVLKLRMCFNEFAGHTKVCGQLYSVVDGFPILKHLNTTSPHSFSDKRAVLDQIQVSRNEVIKNRGRKIFLISPPRPPGMFANCKYCYSKLLLPGARNCEHCLVSSADQRRNSSPPPFCFRELLLAPAPPRRCTSHSGYLNFLTPVRVFCTECAF